MVGDLQFQGEFAPFEALYVLEELVNFGKLGLEPGTPLEVLLEEEKFFLQLLDVIVFVDGVLLVAVVDLPQLHLLILLPEADPPEVLLSSYQLVLSLFVR